MPSETLDIVKILREGGLSIDFAVSREDRVEVSINAAELWAPIIVFTTEALASGAGQLFASAIRDRVGLDRIGRAVLHVKTGRLETKNAEVEWFEGHGNGEDVLQALELFLAASDD
jgi:hypothetical protein